MAAHNTYVKLFSILALVTLLAACSGDDPKGPLQVTKDPVNTPTPERPQTDPTPPAAPKDIELSMGTAGTVVVKIIDDASDATSYQIQRNIPGTAPELLVTLDKNTKIHTDTKATPGNTYEYRACGVNQAGPGAFTAKKSIPVPVVTPEGISVPGEFTLSIQGGGIKLSWVDSSTSEDGYYIERKVAGSSSFDFLFLTAPNITFYLDNTAVIGTRYTYQMKTKKGSVYSGNTQEESTMRTATAPSAPTELEVTKANAATLKFSVKYKDNSNNELGFTISRAPKRVGIVPTESDFSVIGTAEENQVEFFDTNITEGESYWYRVQSFNAAGQSAFTGNVSCGTTATPAAPSVPVLTVERNADAPTSVAELAWEADESAVTFQIHRRLGSGDFMPVGGALGTARKATQSGLAAGTTYSFKIVAMNGAGLPAESLPATLTTSLPVVKPAPPTHLEVSANRVGANSVIWDAYSTAIKNYKLGYKLRGSGNTYTQFPDSELGPNVHSYEHANVTADTTYDYQLSVVNDALVESDPVFYSVRSMKAESGTGQGTGQGSGQGSGQGTPVVLTPPSGFAPEVLPAERGFRFTWQGTLPAGAEFELFRRSETVAEERIYHGVGFEYKDINLQVGTHYTYRLRINKASVTPSIFAAELPLTLPDSILAAPLDFAVVASSSYKAIISWKPIAESVDKYLVKRSADGGQTSTEVVSAGFPKTRPGGNMYIEDNGGLLPESSYQYSIVAIKAGFRDSEPKKIDIRMPKIRCTDCPPAPIIIQVAKADKTSGKVSWSYGKSKKDVPDYFTLERSIDGGETYTTEGKDGNIKKTLRVYKTKNLKPNTHTWFKLTAFKGGKPSVSAPFGIMIHGSKPAVPAIGSVEAANENGKAALKIHINGSLDVSSYILERAVSAKATNSKGSFKAFREVQVPEESAPADGIDVVDDTVEKGKFYRYQVKGKNFFGESKDAVSASWVVAP